MLPNALIIGGHKCGTSSYYDWLAQHPDIYGEYSMKDFHFFANDEEYAKGLHYYKAFFNNWQQEKIILAGGVNYIYFAKALARIKKYKSDIKMILCLRNPVDRAFSAYNYLYKSGRETIPTFEEAIKKDKERQKGDYETRSRFTYIDHGFYFKQLQAFQKFFSIKQLQIVLFDDLKAEPLKSVQQTFQFLGVDPDFEPDLRILKKGGVARSSRLFALMNRDNFLRDFIKRNRRIFDLVLPLKRRRSIKKRISQWNTRPTKERAVMNPDTRKKLIELYRGDIMQLSSLINRDLSDWLS